MHPADSHPPGNRRPKLNAAEARIPGFLTRYIAVVQPLMIKDNVASWDAAASGKASDYAAEEKYETAYKQFHANRATFAQLKRLKASGQCESLAGTSHDR